ncbi:MAG: sulfatase [Acidobacteriota bacterium]
MRAQPNRPAAKPRQHVLEIVLLVATVAALACSNEPPGLSWKGDHVIVIVVDSLRADHLGCYGYSRDTSPNIDRLAAEGITFDRALSNSSFTRESIATLLTGQLPSVSGSIGWGARPATGIPILGELFSNAGYATAFLSTTGVLRAPAFSRGFEHVEHFTERWDVSGMSHDLSRRALEITSQTSDRPLLLYLHYLDPHGPYQPPEELHRRFTPEPFQEPLDLYRQVRPKCSQLVASGFGPGEERFEDLVVRYDAEIADVDRAIADLLAGLDELGTLDDTLIVFTSDHGEEFLEHDFVEHAWTLYRESVHVPLIFWSREFPAPMRIEERVALVDVLPTLLGLLEIPFQPAELSGEAVLAADQGAIRVQPPRKPYFGELLINHRNRVRAVIHQDWKYVAAERWLTIEERSQVRQRQKKRGSGELWRPVVHEELFHLPTDPQELQNLAGSKPEELARMRSLLSSYRNYTGQISHEPITEELSEISEAEREALRALGYLD